MQNERTALVVCSERLELKRDRFEDIVAPGKIFGHRAGTGRIRIAIINHCKLPKNSDRPVIRYTSYQDGDRVIRAVESTVRRKSTKKTQEDANYRFVNFLQHHSPCWTGAAHSPPQQQKNTKQTLRRVCAPYTTWHPNTLLSYPPDFQTA